MLQKDIPAVVQRIDRVRQIRGMTKEALSRRATNDENPAYFGGLTARGQMPGADILVKMAEALDVSPLMFFADFDDIEPMNSILRGLEGADDQTLSAVRDLVDSGRRD